MQIKIGTYTLARDGREGVSAFRINGRRLLQINELIDADEIEVTDRGNRRTVITFVVSRLHASPGDAEAYILEHADKPPAYGLVEFRATRADNRVSVLWMNAAAIEQLESWYVGCSTYHTYSIIGGKLTRTRPA